MSIMNLFGITELKSRSDASKDNTKILMTNNSIDKNGRPASSILSQRNYSKREAAQEVVTYIENRSRGKTIKRYRMLNPLSNSSHNLSHLNTYRYEDEQYRIGDIYQLIH